MPSLLVVLLLGAVGAFIKLSIWIPQSRLTLRLQALRREGHIAYLVRRTQSLDVVAKAFEVADVSGLKWEFLIRVDSQGWRMSNSDLLDRAFVPWSAIGPIRAVDDAPVNKLLRDLSLGVTFLVAGENVEVKIRLMGWVGGAYPSSNDPSAAPVDMENMHAAVRELERLRPDHQVEH